MLASNKVVVQSQRSKAHRKGRAPVSHSFKAFTGFAFAVLNAWKQTVNKLTANIRSTATLENCFPLYRILIGVSIVDTVVYLVLRPPDFFAGDGAGPGKSSGKAGDKPILMSRGDQQIFFNLQHEVRQN